MTDMNWMQAPRYFSALEEVAEAIDDWVKLLNKSEKWVSLHGSTPDLGRKKLIQILEQWPSVASFEILRGENLMTDDEVCSYFGGSPTLPPSVEWPSFVWRETEQRSMNFIGQINCADLTRLDSSHNLPKAGFLYFFESWSDEDGLSNPSCKVIHSYEKPEPQPRALPKDTISTRDWRLRFSGKKHISRPGDETPLTYPRRKLRLAAGRVCLPFADHLGLDHSHLIGFSKKEINNLQNCLDELGYYSLRISRKAAAFEMRNTYWRDYSFLAGGRRFTQEKDDLRISGLEVEHRMLGYPRHKPSSRHFSGQYFKDLVLFAQFESDELMDFDWHDYLEFWISPEDLLSANFANAFAWQSD